MRSKVTIIIILIAVLLGGYFFLPEKFISPFKSAAQIVATPFERLFYGIGSKTRNFVKSVKEIGDLRSENADLKGQLSKLMEQNASLLGVKNENELLKKEIEVRGTDTSRQLLMARVISSEPSDFLQSFTVDQGESAGVKVGQPAIYQGILVGRVTSTIRTSSQITLVLSSHSIIQAELSESRVVGIVKGGLQGLYLDNIPQDVPYKPGELVITSGLGGDLPKGIVIGRVDKVSTPKSEIFQTFSLITPLDFHRIEAVFIIK